MLKITENVLGELHKFIYFILPVPLSLLNVISKLDIVESGQSNSQSKNQTIFSFNFHTVYVIHGCPSW